MLMICVSLRFARGIWQPYILSQIAGGYWNFLHTATIGWLNNGLALLSQHTFYLILQLVGVSRKYNYKDFKHFMISQNRGTMTLKNIFDRNKSVFNQKHVYCHGVHILWYPKMLIIFISLLLLTSTEMTSKSFSVLVSKNQRS